MARNGYPADRRTLVLPVVAVYVGVQRPGVDDEGVDP
jgi:hypothetical protein